MLEGWAPSSRRISRNGRKCCFSDERRRSSCCFLLPAEAGCSESDGHHQASCYSPGSRSAGVKKRGLIRRCAFSSKPGNDLFVFIFSKGSQRLCLDVARG